MWLKQDIGVDKIIVPSWATAQVYPQYKLWVGVGEEEEVFSGFSCAVNNNRMIITQYDIRAFNIFHVYQYFTIYRQYFLLKFEQYSWISYLQHFLKSGGSKDQFRWIKVPGTTPYWNACDLKIYIVSHSIGQATVWTMTVLSHDDELHSYPFALL